MTRRAQLVRNSPDSLQDETDYLNWTTVFVKTTTTQTLSDETLTVTLIPTPRPTSTSPLLRQRLYRTSEAPVKLSHVYYNLTIYVLHTNLKPLYDDYLLTSRKETNRRTDREQYTKSNAATARLLTSVRPAETLARDWPDTNERQEMMTLTRSHCWTHLQTKHQIDWDCATCIAYSTD